MIKFIKLLTILLPSLFPLSTNASGHRNTNIAMFTILNVAVLLVLVFLFVQKLKKTKHEGDNGKYFDMQTGLLNRAGFIHKFESNISDFSRENYHIVYFIIDSNRLQVYFNGLGFSETVDKVAAILSKNVKDYEFVARITESGFAMVLCEKDEIESTKRVMKIMDELSELSDSFGKSIGEIFKSSLYKLDKDDHNCELLFFNLRRNCTNILGKKEKYVYCDKQSMNTVRAEKELTEQIQSALHRGEFKLYVQFIVDNKTKKIVSAEALSRWEDPHKGIRLPGTYIGTMMNSGIITEFDYYMFDKVCAQLQSWEGTELGDLALSCNFTRITISEADFIDKISTIAGKYDFDREKLIMEITEETLENNREVALSNMQKCKN